MPKEIFHTCYNCDKREICAVAALRLKGLDVNSPIIRDIGCFNQEIYRKQIEDKQLKLF